LPDEDDFISNGYAADVAHINDGQVHRNAADDRRVFAAYDHSCPIGKQARITVGVTDGRTAMRLWVLVTNVPM